MKKILIFIIFLLCLFAAPAMAANWYVDCESGAASNGTFAAPFNDPADVQTKIDAANDGDDFYFNNNTTCTSDGTPEKLDLGGIDGIDAANPTKVGCYDGDGDFDKVVVAGPEADPE